jgi:hypothetical protein
VFYSSWLCGPLGFSSIRYCWFQAQDQQTFWLSPTSVWPVKPSWCPAFHGGGPPTPRAITETTKLRPRNTQLSRVLFGHPDCARHLQGLEGAFSASPKALDPSGCVELMLGAHRHTSTHRDPPLDQQWLYSPARLHYPFSRVVWASIFFSGELFSQAFQGNTTLYTCFWERNFLIVVERPQDQVKVERLWKHCHHLAAVGTLESPGCTQALPVLHHFCGVLYGQKSALKVNHAGSSIQKFKLAPPCGDEIHKKIQQNSLELRFNLRPSKNWKKNLQEGFLLLSFLLEQYELVHNFWEEVTHLI